MRCNVVHACSGDVATIAADARPQRPQVADHREPPWPSIGGRPSGTILRWYRECLWPGTGATRMYDLRLCRREVSQ